MHLLNNNKKYLDYLKSFEEALVDIVYTSVGNAFLMGKSYIKKSYII